MTKNHDLPKFHGILSKQESDLLKNDLEKIKAMQRKLVLKKVNKS